MLKTRYTIEVLLKARDSESFDCFCEIGSIIHEVIVKILEIIDPLLASNMVDLRRSRNNASYDMDISIGYKKLERSVNDADFVLECQTDIVDRWT